MLEWIFKRPLAVLAAVAALSIVFAAQIPRLSFRTSIYDLVIEDLPANRRYEAFKAVFGCDEIIRVVIRAGGDVLAPATFEKIRILARRASQIEGVRRVVSLPGIKADIDPRNQWSMRRFAAMIAPAALFKRNLISDDRRTTALTLVIKDGADREQIIDAVDAIITTADPHLRLYQIGMPLVSRALARYTRQDFLRLPPLTFVMVAGMLLLIFRRLSGVLLPLACITLTLIWTFGLMALLGFPISMLLMIVPVFLIAVGTAYCLHIVSAYLQAAGRTASPVEAARQTFGRVTLPVVLAVTTTVIGLASLLVNRITAIREFALFSCFGMLSLLIIVLTFLPAALSLLPAPARPAAAPAAVKPGRLDRLLDRIADINLNHQKISLPLMGLIVAFCAAGMLRLQVQTNPVAFFKADTPISRHFHDIYRDLSGSFPVNVSMQSPEEDYFEDPRHVADIARLQQFLETLPGVDKTLSFADYMKLVNYVINGYKPEYYTLPRERFEVGMIMNNYKTLLGEDMFTRFMGPAYNRANIVLLTHIASSRRFLENRDRILAHVAAHFSRDLDWDVTGFGMVISESSHHLTSGQLKSLSLTMVLVFGVMFLLFLSWKVGLIAIVPNLFPIVISFGLMGWLGIDLSMFTALIASIAIGLAVDDTIHYLVHFNREFQRDLDTRRALRATIASIGRPIVYTTVCICIGFFILTLSSFKPTAILGFLLVVTMVAALAGDLILLPSLMLHVELITLWDLIRNRLGQEPGEKVPLFKGMSRAQVQSVLMAKRLEPFEAGKALFRKGDPSDCMYAIISGEMDVLSPLSEDPSDPNYGSHKRINTLSAGDVVGEMGLLRSMPRSATVVTTRPGELLQINWKMIERLNWLHPPTAHKFFRNLMGILCQRVDHLTACLTDEGVAGQMCPVYPRGLFLDLLNKERQRSHKSGESLCVGLMTIGPGSGRGGGEAVPGGPGQDHTFINECFFQVETCLEGAIRPSDTVGQWDLQTLAILMPQTTISEAQACCDRIHRAIRRRLGKFRQDLNIRIRVIRGAEVDRLAGETAGACRAGTPAEISGKRPAAGKEDRPNGK